MGKKRASTKKTTTKKSKIMPEKKIKKAKTRTTPKTIYTNYIKKICKKNELKLPHPDTYKMLDDSIVNLLDGILNIANQQDSKRKTLTKENIKKATAAFLSSQHVPEKFTQKILSEMTRVEKQLVAK